MQTFNVSACFQSFQPFCLSLLSLQIHLWLSVHLSASLSLRRSISQKYGRSNRGYLCHDPLKLWQVWSAGKGRGKSNFLCLVCLIFLMIRPLPIKKKSKCTGRIFSDVDTLFILFSLCHPLGVIYFKRSTFSSRTYFGASGTMWNQLVLMRKKTREWFRMCLHLLGVTSPYSAPHQLTVAELGGLILCKAAAPLVVKSGRDATIHIHRPHRTIAGSDFVLFFLCVFFFAATVTCFVCIGSGMGLSVWSHNIACVFQSLEDLKYAFPSVSFVTLSAQEAVCMICKCQWKWHTSRGSEEESCWVTKDIQNLEVNQKQTC